jgi:hypothetical protein
MRGRPSRTSLKAVANRKHARPTCLGGDRIAAARQPNRRNRSMTRPPVSAPQSGIDASMNCRSRGREPRGSCGEVLDYVHAIRGTSCDVSTNRRLGLDAGMCGLNALNVGRFSSQEAM